jgi:hypothetical protein
MENESLVCGFYTICKKFTIEVYETKKGLYRYKFYMICNSQRKNISSSVINMLVEQKKISSYAKEYTS